MKKAAVVLLILVVLVLGSAFFYLRHGHVYEIAEADIQQNIVSHFPVEKCVLVFCLELSEPFVRLNDDQVRIEFGSRALMEVAFSDDEYDGSAEYSGMLTYDAAQISFYLSDARLESLQVSGVAEKHKENLDKLAALLVKDYLRANPVYSFKDTTFELIAPWLELKEVVMRDGVLRIRMGLAA